MEKVWDILLVASRILYFFGTIPLFFSLVIFSIKRCMHLFYGMIGTIMITHISELIEYVLLFLSATTISMYVLLSAAEFCIDCLSKDDHPRFRRLLVKLEIILPRNNGIEETVRFGIPIALGFLAWQISSFFAEWLANPLLGAAVLYSSVTLILEIAVVGRLFYNADDEESYRENSEMQIGLYNLIKKIRYLTLGSAFVIACCISWSHKESIYYYMVGVNMMYLILVQIVVHMTTWFVTQVIVNYNVLRDRALGNIIASRGNRLVLLVIFVAAIIANFSDIYRMLYEFGFNVLGFALFIARSKRDQIVEILPDPVEVDRVPITRNDSLYTRARVHKPTRVKHNKKGVDLALSGTKIALYTLFFALVVLLMHAFWILASGSSVQEYECRNLRHLATSPDSPNKEASNFARVGAKSRPSYPICNAQWFGLDIVDYTLLADLAYYNCPPDKMKNELPILFDGSDWEVLTTRDIYVTLWDFYSKSRNLSVIALRGTVFGGVLQFDMLQDADLFVDIALQQMLFMPYFLPDPIVIELVNLTAYLDKVPNYFKHLMAYVTVSSEAQPRHIIFTGHSLGGALAQFAAMKTGHHAITFSSPGTHFTRAKFGITEDAVNHYVTNIVPRGDLVTMVDEQAGHLQLIDCSPLYFPKCHFLNTTMCELWRSCRNGRPLDCPEK